MLSEIIRTLTMYLQSLNDAQEKIAAINELKALLHRHSSFCHEPVDCVLWVAAESSGANDCNPNMMVPVEKKLLRYSIEQEGFTQPVVAIKEPGRYLVVDGFGFHRYLSVKSH